jgi:tRNA(Ile)-lysidine synthase
MSHCDADTSEAMDDSDADLAAYREQIEARVAAFCERHGLLSDLGCVVAAVSGGADSLCLLGVLAALTRHGGRWPAVSVVVAHLDHGLRGAAGAEDARFVREVAAALGLRFHAGTADVMALARSTRHGLEDAARRARYAFLREVAADVGAVRICTGHTQDDQLETLVMRWLRGSGLTGLTGMHPLSDDLARPLLCLTRDETHRYCTAHGWTWREDVTNDDPRFWRNRIRREVLTVLLHENPNLRATLTRTADALSVDDAFIQQAVDRAWPSSVRTVTSDQIALDRAALALLHPAIQRRLVRRAAERLAGGEPSLEWRHAQAMLALVAAGTEDGAVSLPGGLVARLHRDMLVLANESATGAPATIVPATEVELPVPGYAEVPGTQWRVCAELLDARAGAPPPGTELSSYGSDYVGRDMLRPAVGTAQSVGRAQMRAYLDADTVTLPLRVRTWRPGDRFRPLGMSGEKKLQDYFVDARVPRAERGSIPLVWGADHLLWVAGHRLDDRARIKPQTERVLALRLEPIATIDARADSAGDEAHRGRAAEPE